MFNYLIRTKFKSSKKIDFTQHLTELNNAVDTFNNSSQERGKNALLKIHQVSAKDFSLILESPSILTQPSKALVKFSQALTTEATIKPYIVNGNQLIRCVHTSILNSPNTTLTDGQLLNSIVLFIHNTDCCTDSSKLKKRQQLLDDIKNLVKSSGLI